MDGILYCLNLNLYMHFTILSKSPVTVNKKLYVTTANNSFHPLPIFCHKELHLRGHKGLDLNIVKWFTKILKDIRENPLPTPFFPSSMIKYNLGKIWIFQITFFAFNIIWTNWMQCQLIDIDCGFVKNFCAVYLVKAYNHLIS